jgi:hypothetical protein
MAKNKLLYKEYFFPFFSRVIALFFCYVFFLIFYFPLFCSPYFSFYFICFEQYKTLIKYENFILIFLQSLTHYQKKKKKKLTPKRDM